MTVGGGIKNPEKKQRKTTKMEKPRKETGKNQGNEDLKEKGNTVKTHERY